jgi:hypothetical protein
LVGLNRRFRHERKADHLKGASNVSASLIINDAESKSNDEDDDDGKNTMQSVKMDSEMERILKSLSGYIRR